MDTYGDIIGDQRCGKTVSNKYITNLEAEDSRPSLNYDSLELLSKLEPEKIFSIFTNNDNFKSTLNKCLDVTDLIRLMSIFSKIKVLKLGKIKTDVLDIICDSHYLKHLSSLVDVTILLEFISESTLQEFFDNCKILLEIMVNPKSKELLNEIIDSVFIELSSVGIKELELKNHDLEIEKMIQKMNNLKITENVRYIKKKFPYCYENLSVYPLKSDINHKKVILSPNILKGSYDNVEHYVDVQYRLLREDFIAPMREGIQFYKAINKDEHVNKMPNMRMYFKSKIEKKISVKDAEDDLYVVKFCTREDISYDSKRFMFESLLVFSGDNFNSLFFAIVIKINQSKLLPLKKLTIKLLDNNLIIKSNTLYTMAECGAYFLPYKYTLSVLKKFNDFNFPMKSYIIYGETKPNTPKYLKYGSSVYKINGLQFDILDDSLWPDNQILGLDNSQYMAFKEALTKEFTVIQGPPGTGKTFIGLRIARSIIENLYETNKLKCPIVVVCYTNHALDQFLEGLLSITNKIVRVGGGSKSNVIKRYMLKTNIKSPLAYIKLKNSYVVGLTTTGASMKMSVLLKLKPPIVIVEEAAEVLESHIVASLTEFCEHVILIGDHKQLRPKTSTFALRKKFNFDVSLFERLINNGFPCSSLSIQHRMRPEISDLILPIYPFLKDHESVKNRCNIRGVTKNVYFIHHEVNEDKVIGSKSRKNMHEVNFFMKFARYLLKQGYQQSQITLLVTYKAQLLELQKIRETSCYLEDFRIECVDGYQGEENDIVLLSLVRNNINNNIGFLNIENRVCVALSRARNGFYIMGNMDNLKHSSLWKKIRQILVDQQCLGNKLSLHCENHKDWITTVSNSCDFSAVQCLKECNIKMDCGHDCPMLCHFCDLEHKHMYRCKKLFKRTLACGFIIKIECWMRFLKFECPSERRYHQNENVL